MAVRVERVVLEVEDRATRPMSQFAAATTAASGALHDLDGTGVASTRSVAATGTAAASAAPKVSSLAAATSRVEVGQRRQADAAGSLRVAETKLQELREKGNAKASSLAAAEERVSKARRNLSAETIKVAAATEALNRANDDVVVSTRKADRSINQLTGRLALARDVAVTLGPALAPLGAVGAAAVSTLASAAGFAAIGAGTMVAGFNGVFDALDALNAYQLERTPENLEKLRQQMALLSPEARSMVREIDQLGPALRDLRDASAEGMAPEIERGVDNLLEGLPRLRGLFEETAEAAASVAADGAGALTSERWQPFLNFLEREAPRAVESLGDSAGDVAHGLAELWRAMDPLNDDGLAFIERGAAGFDRWASGLKGSEDFEEFVAYVRDNGPLLADAMGATAGAVLDIAEAAAPLGGPVLQSITAIAEGVSAVADSPFGTPFFAAAATLVTINRGLKITQGLVAAVAGSSMLGGAAGVPGKGAPALVPGTVIAGTAGASAAKPGKHAARRPTGPGAVAALGGLLVAPTAIEAVQDLTGGYEGLETSVGDVARALRDGNLPDEFDNIGEHAEMLDRRSESSFTSFRDKVDSAVGMVPEKIEEARTELGALDEALGQMARRRGLGAAQRAFNDFADTLDLSGAERSTLLSQLPTMGDRLSSFGGQAKDVSAEMRQLASDLFGIKMPKLDLGLDKKMLTGTIAGITDALDGLDKKKARPRAELESNPFFQSYNRVRGGVGDLDKQKPTPTAGLNAAPFTRTRAQVMSSLGVTDRFTASPLVNLIDNASGRIGGIINQLDNIPRQISTTVTTYFRQVGKSVGGRAGGGWVFGEGGPRDDAIPMMLSNGEYVVNAAAAARNAALLEQINSGRLAGAAAASQSPTAQQVSVSLNDVRLSGTVDTRTGLATMTGIARAVANQEIDNWERSENARAGL